MSLNSSQVNAPVAVHCHHNHQVQGCAAVPVPWPPVLGRALVGGRISVWRRSSRFLYLLQNLFWCQNMYWTYFCIIIYICACPYILYTMYINHICKLFNHTILIGFLRAGCPRGGGNWGTLRIPKEDWGTLGNIRETPPLGPPLNNPIKFT